MTISKPAVKTHMMEFHEMMDAAMEQKGLSLRDMAKEVGTTYEYMRMIHSGGRLPSTPTLRNICRVLDLNVADAEKVVKLKRMSSSKSEIAEVFPEGLQEIMNAWDSLSANQQAFLQKAVSEWTKK